MPREGRVDGIFHSYFDGEADGAEDLKLPEGAVFEDALPVLLRGLDGALLDAGESRTVPFLPSLLHARLTHTMLAWTTAQIARSEKADTMSVPAGRFEVTTFTVDVEDGRRLTFSIEAAPPHRLIRQTGPGGEQLALTGSTRMAYWKLNTPGSEKHLEAIGLSDD